MKGWLDRPILRSHIAQRPLPRTVPWNKGYIDLPKPGRLFVEGYMKYRALRYVEGGRGGSGAKRMDSRGRVGLLFACHGCRWDCHSEYSLSMVICILAVLRWTELDNDCNSNSPDDHSRLVIPLLSFVDT